MRQQLYRAVRKLARLRRRAGAKPQAALLLLFLAGCSTAPVADFLDFFFPPRFTPGASPYGGVCAPKPIGPAPPGTAQPVIPPPGVPVGPPGVPVGPPAPAVVDPNSPPPPPPPPATTTLQRPVPVTPVANSIFPVPKS
jgi:hypothetical protein